MRNTKKILPVTLLLALYVVVMVSVCFYQSQDFYNFNSHESGEYTSHFVHSRFTHTTPTEYLVSVQIPWLFRLPHGGDNYFWDIQLAHAFQFKSLLSKQLIDWLDILVKHRKADILYPFHFFW
ncbi:MULTISPECIES: hypothetical protein [Reichenbachiella]|uniref:hypothetical protein n=1 Tax=Reichenbachiella TaxID=156993 RepID=UPI001114D01F|nr:MULTISPECIES: hypothetical protein [Reichenbachiella]